MIRGEEEIADKKESDEKSLLETPPPQTSHCKTGMMTPLSNMLSLELDDVENTWWNDGGREVSSTQYGGQETWLTFPEETALKAAVYDPVRPARQPATRIPCKEIMINERRKVGVDEQGF